MVFLRSIASCVMISVSSANARISFISLIVAIAMSCLLDCTAFASTKDIRFKASSCMPLKALQLNRLPCGTPTFIRIDFTLFE